MNIKRFWAVFFALFLVFALPLTTVVSAAEKKKYKNFQEVALDMGVEFASAQKSIDEGDLKAAYDAVNNAYFGYYEVQGFEASVMNFISTKRVNEIESLFREIKHKLLGNREANPADIKERIDVLEIKVYRDALVLDGVETKESADDVGLSLKKTHQLQSADPSQVKRVSFLTSFALLLREGLEAILVCVAIITYLIKSGNRHLCKGVYLGMLAGVIGSVILAYLIELILGGVGKEMVEGWTMFLAVAVLFYVSHWMLHRSEEQAWEAYIQKQVDRSLGKNSQLVLIGAAFLAVIREGAELILFYKATISSGLSDFTYSALGFLAAIVVLVVIYVLMRYSTVRLPLRPFFMFTSILLFIMCISFMGKGVKELTEAGVISGSSSLPFMNGFEVDLLGIYPRAETVIPQVMILIGSAWIVLSSALRNRKAKKVSANQVAEKTI